MVQTVSPLNSPGVFARLGRLNGSSLGIVGLRKYLKISGCSDYRIVCLSARNDFTSKKSSVAVETSSELWWAKNDNAVRSSPLVLGITGGVFVVLNRALSGIAPVADAGSSQSRADVICLALAATLILTGLVWKSIKPRDPKTAQLTGIQLFRQDPSLPSSIQKELEWSWQSFQSTMRCQSLVIVYKNKALLQAGLVRESEQKPGEGVQIDTPRLSEGSICQTATRDGSMYIANLELFPGRFELDFFPSKTQAVIVQPLGESGFLLLASGTVRGFGPLDQAWIATVAQKLDSTLQDWNELS